jgi:Yip1 domain
MATTSMPFPEPQPQAAITPLGRIIGMFFSPGATFADIVRKPTWILPLVLIVTLSTGAVVALNSHFDWKSYVAQQIEKSPRAANLSAEQKQQQAETGAKFSPIFAYVFGIPVPVIGLLVVTLALWGAFNLMAGAGADFKRSWAIVTHAFVPASVIATLLFVLVLFLKPVGGFDLDNPVATNLAILLPEDAAKWLVGLCKNVDLLEFWKVILLAIGFQALNPKKLKGGKAFTIVLSTFLVYVMIRTALAFVMS